MVIKFNIKNQKIICDKTIVVEKSKNYLTGKFDFQTPDWDGCEKTAYFKNLSTGVEDSRLLVDNECNIPASVTNSTGYVEVSVHGVKDDTVITSGVCEFLATRTISNENNIPNEDLTLYEQLLSKIGNKVPKNGWQPDMYLGTDENGNVVEKEAPEGTGGNPQKGEDGGYYTPKVEQTSEDTVNFAFSPSKNNMNAVYPVSIKLPRGKDGVDGANGTNGKDGKDGIGIQSVEQTTTSTEDGGENVVTVTLTDGQKSTFTVRNGSQGNPGTGGGGDIDLSDYATKEEVEELSQEIDDTKDILNTPIRFNKASDALINIGNRYKLENVNMALEDYFVRGYSINANGVKGNNNDWGIYDYKILVSGHDAIYTRQVNQGQNGNITLSFYTADDTFISRSMLNLGLTVNRTDIPIDAEYALVCRTVTSTPWTIVSFENIPDTPYIYHVGKIISDYDNEIANIKRDVIANTQNVGTLLEDVYVPSDNILNRADYVDGKAINGSGVVYSNADWGLFDKKYQTDGHSKIYIKNFSSKNGQCTFSFFKENGEFVSRTLVLVVNNYGNYLESATIPNEASYVMVSITNTNYNALSYTDDLMVCFDYEPSRYTEYGDTVAWEKFTDSINLSSGKSLRFCLIGDVHCGESGGYYNPSNPSAEGTSWDSKGAYAGANRHERMQLLVDTINKEHNKKPFDFILSTGDLALEGGTSSQAEFNNPKFLKEFCEEYLVQLPCTLFAAPGNHDCFAEEDWQKYTGLPRQFSFETDDFYFICLDVFSNITMGANTETPSTTKGIGYDHVDFDYLESEYKKAKDKKVILVAHSFASNPYSELGKDDDAKMQAFVQSHPNVLMTIVGHSHSYHFKTWWGIPSINSNHFCYPTKQWADAYNDHSKLWSISVVEISENGTEFQTYYVQPEHNYVGMGLNYPYTVGNTNTICKVKKDAHADFYAPTFNKMFGELTKTVTNLSARVAELEKITDNV